MAVTTEKLIDAIDEAQRFIEKAQAAVSRMRVDKFAHYGCKETGAVRRSSMDLSCSLVKIRSSED